MRPTACSHCSPWGCSLDMLKTMYQIAALLGGEGEQHCGALLVGGDSDWTVLHIRPNSYLNPHLRFGGIWRCSIWGVIRIKMWNPQDGIKGFLRRKREVAQFTLGRHSMGEAAQSLVQTDTFSTDTRWVTRWPRPSQPFTVWACLLLFKLSWFDSSSTLRYNGGLNYNRWWS